MNFSVYREKRSTIQFLFYRKIQETRTTENLCFVRKIDYRVLSMPQCEFIFRLLLLLMFLLCTQFHTLYWCKQQRFDQKLMSEKYYQQTHQHCVGKQDLFFCFCFFSRRKNKTKWKSKHKHWKFGEYYFQLLLLLRFFFVSPFFCVIFCDLFDQ